jgi:hypothetical protein
MERNVRSWEFIELNFAIVYGEKRVVMGVHWGERQSPFSNIGSRAYISP